MKIPMEDWLRGCVYHDGRHGEVTLSTDKVLEIANYIQLTRTSLADGMIELPPYDHKTENSSEKPTGSEPKTEPQTEETEMERLERIDNELEDAWTRIRELTDEPQTERSNE